MTLVLNGSTGVSAVDGSASTPAIQGNDTNTGVFFPASDTVGISTNGTERMRVDSSGNVGIGTSSPGFKTEIVCSDSNGIQIKNSGGTTYGGMFVETSAMAYGTRSNTPMRFITNDAERMRIDSSGNVGIGTSSPTFKLDVSGIARVNGGALAVQSTGSATLPGTGYGWEIYNVNSTTNYLQSYNRTSSAFMDSVYNAATHQFYVSGSERMRIDSSGNVGIGVTPTYKFQVGAHNSFADNLVIFNEGTTAGNGGVNIANYYNNTTNIAGIKYTSTSSTTGNIIFYTNPGTGIAERARFTSDAKFKIGTTGTIWTSNEKMALLAGTEDGLTISSSAATMLLMKTAFANNLYIAFGNSSATILGSITSGGANVSYNTSSDYRLKDNIRPLTGGLERVMQLKPSEWDWKTDGSSGVGFIAHEAQVVRPQAVTGTKDEVDADGKPVYQGIDASYLIADLTSAIQELNAKVEGLQAEINALKGAA